MKAPNLSAMDEVALQKDIPDQELRYGDIGVVIRSFREGTYDVEIENNLGKNVTLKQLSKEDLLLVRKSRG